MKFSLLLKSEECRLASRDMSTKIDMSREVGTWSLDESKLEKILR